SPQTAADDARHESKPSPVAVLTSKVSSLLERLRPEHGEQVAVRPRRKRPESASRSARTSRTAPRTGRAAAESRSGRPTHRTATSRSRHVRPPETEIIEPVAERPRRTRSGRHAEPPPPPAEPRRRPRPANPR